jgi:hypothetical protein
MSSPGLTVSVYGRWKDAGPVPPTNHLLATAHPVAGIERVHFKLSPRFVHHSVPLIVTGSGKAYQTMASHTVIDRVT